jgi:hypothetical protein
MIKEDYFHQGTRACLDGSDIEMVNYQLEKIEKSREACSAVASVLTFLNNNPENAVKGMPPCREKEIIEEILARTMGEFTRSRGATTRGLISMIEIISGTLIEVEHDITTTIEQGIEGSQLNKMRNVTA